MAKKVKVTFTIDRPLFNSFKKALPDYVSVSGVLAAFVQESLNGFTQGRSLSDTFKLLKAPEPVKTSGGLLDGPVIL